MNNNYTKNLLLFVLAASAISFTLVSLLSAGYLALYHFLRDHFGLGFWQVVFLYAAFATGLSLLSVLAKSDSRS
jgi:hypothetical protein